MGKLRRVMRCYHCGAVLQSKSKKEKGYIDPSFLKSDDAENQVLYCRSCYEKMSIINKGMLEADADDEIIKILKDAVATDAIILWAVDLFNFNGTLNPEIVKKVKKLKVAVIGTKRDLFSSRIKDETLISYLKERFNEVGIEPIGIFLFGNEDKLDADKYIKMLHEARQGHDVYMIGTFACGKTSIISRMLKSYSNPSKRVIKSVTYPGTSARMLEIPLSNSSFCYEVPGFSLCTSVLGKVEKEVVKQITPRKKVDDHTRSMLEGETIMLGSLAAFSLVKGKPTTFKVYTSEMVELKKVFTKNLETALAENSAKKLVRPVSDRFTAFTDYDLFEYVMENDGQVHDIAVSGLGWISFVAKGQIIRVLLPKGVAVKECLGKIR